MHIFLVTDCNVFRSVCWCCWYKTHWALLVIMCYVPGQWRQSWAGTSAVSKPPPVSVIGLWWNNLVWNSLFTSPHNRTSFLFIRTFVGFQSDEYHFVPFKTQFLKVALSQKHQAKLFTLSKLDPCFFPSVHAKFWPDHLSVTAVIKTGDRTGPSLLLADSFDVN